MGDGVGAALVIGNPLAGQGRVVRRWDELLGRMAQAGVVADGRLTERPGHATELARKARSEGRELVVAVGGDGTVHEVVNGLLADGLAGSDRSALGLIPAGSGCDYARTFGVPSGLDAAVVHLASTAERHVDVGEVRCLGIDGEEHVRLFVNVAEVGIGAERAARLPRLLGPCRYTRAFVLTPAAQHSVAAEVSVDGQRTEGPLTNLRASASCPAPYGSGREGSGPGHRRVQRPRRDLCPAPGRTGPSPSWRWSGS